MPDETNDPALRSWVESANDGASDFPIQNLPFGVFRLPGQRARVGVAIGDEVLDLTAARKAGVLSGEAAAAAEACKGPTLNSLMARGPKAWHALRVAVNGVLRTDAPPAVRMSLERTLVPMSQVEMMLPAETGDYTDFYSSLHHATNVGSMFRPDNPLMPNYKYVPIGYHGRASSLVPTGRGIRRPSGQTKDEGKEPQYGPTRRLDYECEVGAFIGRGNALGEPILIDEAEEHIFGLCLVNDWSARDVQAWEYQPLGPFLAKNFATTVSPWVVTMEALAPYRAPAFKRPEGDPAPLPYLSDAAVTERGGIGITLEVLLRTAAMRASGTDPQRVSRASFSDMYWTIAQLITHHTSNGCNLVPGDLIASGTVSGAEPGSRGCLLELAWRGSQPLELPGGEKRAFLEDGDEVIMRGYCVRDGYPRIGFGECAGQVLPAEVPNG